jgi:hypothetical protein
VQLRGHDVCDAREGLECRVGVEEGEARAAREDIDRCQRVLMPHCVAYLCFDDCPKGVSI